MESAFGKSIMSTPLENLIALPLDRIFVAVSRHLGRPESLKCVLGDIYVYYRGGPGRSLVRLCLAADCLRVAIGAVAADRTVSDDERNAMLPLFRELAHRFAECRSEYAGFATMTENQISGFLRFYWKDENPFGYKHERTHLAGLAICCNVRECFDDTRPGELYLTMANDLSAWILQLDGVTAAEAQHLQGMRQEIERQLGKRDRIK